jgi:hypothetical protein
MSLKVEKDQRDKADRIIKRLKLFNRKERDHLIKYALFHGEVERQISDRLWKEIGPKKPTFGECSIFIGMDYHLNWLFAALATAKEEKLQPDRIRDNRWSFPFKGSGKDKNARPIQSNQEDVDLLVAWSDPANGIALRLVLIEAKLDSGWDKKQFKRKKERLTMMRLDSRRRGLAFIEWDFYLMSPNGPPNNDFFSTKEFVGKYSWMKSPDETRGTHSCCLRHIEFPSQGLSQVKRLSDSGEGRTKWVIRGGSA